MMQACDDGLVVALCLAICLGMIRSSRKASFLHDSTQGLKELAYSLQSIVFEKKGSDPEWPNPMLKGDGRNMRCNGV